MITIITMLHSPYAENTDYDSLTKLVLMLNASTIRHNVAVTITNDNDIEGPEQFFATLQFPKIPPPDGIFLAPHSASIEILGNCHL